MHSSTSYALISACHQISSVLDAQPSSCTVFIDLKKAFDSVSHAHLLEKLYSLDLPSFLFSWFKSCLTGRSQRVHIGTSLSDSLPILSGIPQGSILGPLLFIIFFNDIALFPSSFPFLYTVYLCRWYVLLLHPANCPADIAFLNLDLRTISLWLSQKSLCINVTKSKYMFFSFRAQSILSITYLLFPSLAPALKEFAPTISWSTVNTITLSWTFHINSLHSRAKRILGIIYWHFYQFCSSPTLLVLYKSLIRPILEYCSIFWDSSSMTTIIILNTIEYLALKIVSKTWSSKSLWPSTIYQLFSTDESYSKSFKYLNSNTSCLTTPTPLSFPLLSLGYPFLQTLLPIWF